MAGAIKSKPMDALSPFFIVIQERHEWKIYHPVTVALTDVEQGRDKGYNKRGLDAKRLTLMLLIDPIIHHPSRGRSQPAEGFAH